jgi:hypothetical protein
MAPGVGMRNAGRSLSPAENDEHGASGRVRWGMTAAARGPWRHNGEATLGDRVDDVSLVREFGRMRDPVFSSRSEHLGVRYEIYTLSFLP